MQRVPTSRIASKRASKPTEVAEWQVRLRAAGLKSTGPRLAVLQHLAKAQTPMSHGDLYDVLAHLGYDRATIYRNLIDMSDAGLVKRTDLGDHVWRFELKGPEGDHTGEHPHFVCTDCGEVSCLPGISLKITGKERTPKSIAKKNVELQIKGQCDDCGE